MIARKKNGTVGAHFEMVVNMLNPRNSGYLTLEVESLTLLN